MKPYVILHNETSLDGRIDWIQPDLGRYYGLVSRWQEDATLAGCDTILSNPPEETEAEQSDITLPQGQKDTRPLLVIPDSRGRLRCWRALRGQPYWRDRLALCSQATPQEYLDYLQAEGVTALVHGQEHVDLPAALAELKQRFGVNTLRLDSGGTLNGVMLRAGLVDEVSLLLEPQLVGGSSPQSFFRAPDQASFEDVVKLKLLDLERFDDGVVWLRYAVVKVE